MKTNAAPNGAFGLRTGRQKYLTANPSFSLVNIVLYALAVKDILMTDQVSTDKPGGRKKTPPAPGPELPPPTRVIFRQWLPVVCLALVGFIFVTTELMPIGLLPDISADFNRPQAQVGLMVTVYAWLVALCSLPLTMATARLNRKKLLLIILIGFTLSQLLASLAANFFFLLGARLLNALCHAIYWSIAPPLAVRVAPPGGATRALTLMAIISSLATILGMPLGAMIGHALGWRITFVLIGLISLGICGLLMLNLPANPAAARAKQGGVFQPFKNWPLLRVYILTALTVSGHFTAFTYISPFLAEVGGFRPETIAMFLLWLGGAGIIGNLTVARFLSDRAGTALAFSLSLLAASLFLAGTAAATPLGTALLFLTWGASMGASSLNFQTTVIKAAEAHQDVANSLYSSIFNIGIGGGALWGSLIVRSFGVPAVTAGSGFMALAALAVALGSMRRRG